MNDPSVDPTPLSPVLPAQPFAGQTTPFQDAEHLRLLSVFHCVVGGIVIAFGSVFLIHFFVGLWMLRHPEAMGTTGGPSGQFSGGMFAIMGGCVVLAGWVLGGLNFFAARCLKTRRNYVFLMVVAGIDCALVSPIGTALGVFDFLVLLRPSVKALFSP